MTVNTLRLNKWTCHQYFSRTDNSLGNGKYPSSMQVGKFSVIDQGHVYLAFSISRIAARCATIICGHVAISIVSIAREMQRLHT